MEQKLKGNSRQRWDQGEQDIRDLLSEYDRQDGTIKEFCKSKLVPEWRFYTWKKKYGGILNKSGNQSGFVPLQVHKLKQDKVLRCGELFAEVMGENGKCIRIFQQVPPSYLQALIS
jgi:hypothetical protein